MLLTQTSPVAATALTRQGAVANVQTRDFTTFWIITAALVAFVLKLVIASNTFGTNDVITFYEFARSLHQHGLRWTYQNDISFNHPPLTAYYLRAIYQLDHQPAFREFGLSFPLLVRLPGIFADLITERAWSIDDHALKVRTLKYACRLQWFRFKTPQGVL